MILDLAENFLFFATMFGVCAFGVAWLGRYAAHRRPALLPPARLAQLYAATLVLPPLTAVWVVCAAILPTCWLGEHDFWTAHPAPHAQHLITGVTGGLDPTVGYAVLMLVAGSAVVVAWSTARGHGRLAWAVARLRLTGAAPPAAKLALVEAAARRHGLDVGLIQSDQPVSFVWGFRRSKLVLSSGLIETLGLPELAAVLEHEGAHHARRDNLVKLALTICAHASLAAPLGRRLLRWRNEQVELVCDETAARTTGPLDVAEALVKLHRRAYALMAPVSLGASRSSFVADDAPSVERRVRHLVALTDSRSAAAPGGATSRALAALAAVFALSLAAVAAWAPLAVHTAAEALLLGSR